MSSTLQKITARAKLIRKAHPSKKWTDCIKQASRELKSGKPGSTAKRSGKRKRVGAAPKYRQTGSSVKRLDKKRKAKAPGKRVVKHPGGKSTVYYERRKNRSDKPGSLNGVSAASLKTELRRKLEEKLGIAEVKKFKARLKREKAKIQKQITTIKAELRKLK